MRSVEHAGLDLGGQHVEAFGDQPAGLAHAFERARAVQLDLAGLARRSDCGVDVGHSGAI